MKCLSTWLALTSICMFGCGKKDKAKPTAAASSSPSQAVAESRQRDDDPPKSTLKDCIEYLPDGLTSAVGFRPGELAKTEMGKGVLKQLGMITGVLEKVGIPLDSIEHVWVGSKGGDMVLCARTRNTLDARSVKVELDRKASRRVEGLDLLPISASSRNAICLPDARTILVGRIATVEAALRGGQSAARRGYNTNGLAAPFWFAGDRKSAEAHLTGGSVPFVELESAAVLAIRAFGVGVNFGDKVDLALAMEFGSNGSAKAAEQSLNRYFEEKKNSPDSGSQGGEGGGSRGRGPRGGSSTGKVDPPPTKEGGLAGLLSGGPYEQRRGVRGASKGSGGSKPGGDDGGAQPGSSGADDGGGRSRSRGDSDQSKGSKKGDSDDDEATQSRYGPAGLKAEDVKAEIQTPEVDGSTLRFTLHYNVQIVPFNAILLQSLGGLLKGDGTFRGTLDSIGSGYNELASRTSNKVGGLKRVDNSPVAYSYGWMCELLPHLGYQDIYDRLDYRKSWVESPSTLLQAGKTITEFLDPADRQTRWKGYPFDNLALSHFVGMSGVEDGRSVVAAELPRSDPRAGVFGYDRIASLEEIKDGTTQTIMMVGAGQLKGLWIQGGGASIRGARAPLFDDLTGFGNKSVAGGGTLAVMADGSVREISSNVDPKVFNAMCTIAGQEKVDLPTK